MGAAGESVDNACFIVRTSKSGSPKLFLLADSPPASPSLALASSTGAGEAQTFGRAVSHVLCFSPTGVHGALASYRPSRTRHGRLSEGKYLPFLGPCFMLYSMP